MTRRHLLVFLGALSLFASQASAQRYNLKKQPDQLNEFSIGFSLVMPYDVKISNLGNVYDVYNNEGEYNDFGVKKDDSYDDGIRDGKSYAFEFLDVSQLCDIDGNMNPIGGYVKGMAVKAMAADGTFDKTGLTDVSLSMDVALTHYFDKRHTFGFVVDISSNGFQRRTNADWEANLYTRTDVYKYEGLDGVDGYSGSTTRPHIYSPSEPNYYVYLDKVNSYTKELLNDDGTNVTTTVDGAWELDAEYISLRLGAVYNFRLSRHLSIKASGGFALVSASCRFLWDETYDVVDDDGNPLHEDLTSIMGDDYSEIEDEGEWKKHKWLVGGWTDLGAQYRVNRTMTVFSTLGFQSTTSLRMVTSAGNVIDLDSSKLYSIKGGFAWSF